MKLINTDAILRCYVLSHQLHSLVPATASFAEPNALIFELQKQSAPLENKYYVTD
jgi:hypothetical protein